MVTLDIRSVIKDMYYNGLEGMVEIPVEMNAWWDDIAALNDQAAQQAMGQMVGFWGESGKHDLPDYVEYTQYITGSDGYLLRTITIRVYDVNAGDNSGDVYRNGVKVDDKDANNDGYEDGTVAQWIVDLFGFRSKKKSSSSSGNGDDDDTDGLIVFIPPFVNYVRVDTAPYYGPAMLSRRVLSELAANGGLDALRDHVAAQQQLGMSPDPVVLQQLLDAHFVQSTFVDGALNMQALSLNVVNAP